MPKFNDENDIKKMYFKMGEVSTMLGVAPSLIRFWEKEFDCLKDLAKNRKGDRLFTEKNIHDLRTIHYLVKEKGYTLQGANEHLEQNRKLFEKNAEIVKSLEKLKDFLEEIKQNL